MSLVDTSPAAHAAQLAAYRRMGGPARTLLAARMSAHARQITRDGIRSRHPHYSSDDVEHALNRLLLGDRLFAAAWPDAPLLSP